MLSFYHEEKERRKLIPSHFLPNEKWHFKIGGEKVHEVHTKKINWAWHQKVMDYFFVPLWEMWETC